MIPAVDQGRLDVDNREAGENARSHDAVDALFDARNEFLRHRAAEDFALEGRAHARLVWLEDNLDLCVLAGTAGLLLMGVRDLDPPGQFLAIGDLWRADIGVDLIGAPQNIDLDVEMEFAHALQDRLPGFRIGRNPEG